MKGPPDGEPSRRRGWAPALLAGGLLAGGGSGLAAGLLVVFLAAEWGWPAPTKPASANADEPARLTALEGAAASLRASLDQSASRLAAAEAGAKEMAAILADLRSKIERENAAPRQDLQGLQDFNDVMTRLQAVETDQASRIAALSSDMQEIAARSASLQKEAAAMRGDIAVLHQAVQTVQPDRSAALLLILDRLEQDIRAGRSFRTALEAAQRLAAVPDALASLEASAERGLPGIDALARNFDAALPAIREALAAKPAEASSEPGLVDRMVGALTADIRVTREGDPDPSGPEAPLAAIREALRRGDVAAAIQTFMTLPENARQAGQSWLDEARPSADALGLLQRLSADALAMLTRAGAP